LSTSTCPSSLVGINIPVSHPLEAFP
jgi:hypothetical protein